MKVDLVFSDIVMPGEIGGIDLADIVRKQFSHIGVVLATGYSERPVATSEVRTIGKPYDISALITLINEELKHTKEGQPRTVDFEEQ